MTGSQGVRCWLTVLAAALVAANLSPRTMVWGFSIFILASMPGSRKAGGKATLLVIQNAVLLLINILGVWAMASKSREKSHR